jgi:hypothetical protein
MSGSPHILFIIQLRAFNLPKPENEYRFNMKRRWRLDLAWPAQKIGVEIHGGVFRFGRHTRGAGFTADREKTNAATEAGWRVFEYTTSQVESGAAVRQIARVLIRLKAREAAA